MAAIGLPPICGCGTGPIEGPWPGGELPGFFPYAPARGRAPLSPRGESRRGSPCEAGRKAGCVCLLLRQSGQGRLSIAGPSRTHTPADGAEGVHQNLDLRCRSKCFRGVNWLH
jgi:hypothetical protein